MEKFPIPLEKVVYFFVFLSLIEMIAVLFFFKQKKNTNQSAKETVANLSVWSIKKIYHYFTGIPIAVFVLSLFQPFSLTSIKITPWTFFIALFLVDFFYYWNHRLSHEIRLLWTYHSVHHSSDEFNLSTALRLPVLGLGIDALFYAPLVIIGFPPLLVAFCKSIILISQYWIHTQHIKQIPFFDTIFNSPSNHRVHHGSNTVYLDKNHGGILMIWDHLFGTYQKEKEKVVFGLTKPLGSHNPFYIQFYDLFQLIKTATKIKGLGNKMAFVFGSPGDGRFVHGEEVDGHLKKV